MSPSPMDNPNPNRGSFLPWLVTLAALVVMIIVLMQQRPHPPSEPEQPADPNDLTKVNQLLEKGQWQATDTAAFKEIYDRLPGKQKLETSQALARAINSKKVLWPPDGPPFASGGKPATACSPPTCPPAGTGTTGTQPPTPGTIKGAAPR